MNESTSQNPNGSCEHPCHCDYSLAFLLLRGWLGLRALLAGELFVACEFQRYRLALALKRGGRARIGGHASSAGGDRHPLNEPRRL